MLGVRCISIGEGRLLNRSIDISFGFRLLAYGKCLELCSESGKQGARRLERAIIFTFRHSDIHTLTQRTDS